MPIIPALTQPPGCAAIAAGWMIAWYVVWLTRYGNTPIGDLSRKTTVYCPLAVTPAGSKYGVRPALELFSRTYCRMLATTSWAVSVFPLWNLTPRRIWNVHTVASAFAFQLVASAGRTRPCGFVKVRYSPGMPANASEPPSLRR